MAFSYVKYTGNGSNKVFAVPFKYLDRKHIAVKAAGQNVSFSWLSDSTIQTTAAPANGAEVEVRRKTPNMEPMVDFTDGATVTERDLDLLAYQNVFLNQEAADFAEEIGADAADAASAILFKVDQSLTAASAAQTDAETARITTDSILQTVTNTSSQVNLDKATAQAAATTATTKASEASTSASTASAAAATATTKAGEASSSASAAAASAASAAAAANFDPTTWYTRGQTDNLLATSVFTMAQVSGLQTSLDAKAALNHTHAIADVTGLQTALDGKLSATANAASASKLATIRTFSLTGVATGSGTFDGSANCTIALTLASNLDLPGAPTVATATATDSSTQIANTSWVQARIATLAPKASPAFSGTPTVPTAAAGTNSTQAASTAFVASAVSGLQTSLNFATGLANDMSAGGIGSLVFARIPATTTVTFGATLSGSSIQPSSTSEIGNGVALSGVWRCLGYSNAAGNVTLFIRIS